MLPLGGIHRKWRPACTQKANKKTPGSVILFKRKERGFLSFFSLPFDSRAEVTVSLKEELFCFLKKLNNQYLWPPNRKLSLHWGSMREIQAISGTEQGRYCAELDNTLGFSTPALGN